MISRSSSRLKKWYESLFNRKFKGFRPILSARFKVFVSAIAPAASVGPSPPSVPPLRTTIFFLSAISMAAARTNSWFRPPSPLPVIFTVVSPPESMQAGGGMGMPVFRLLSWKKEQECYSPFYLIPVLRQLLLPYYLQ